MLLLGATITSEAIDSPSLLDLLDSRLPALVLLDAKTLGLQVCLQNVDVVVEAFQVLALDGELVVVVFGFGG
jgi:hypothetical protein